MTDSWLHLREAASFIEHELKLTPGNAEGLLVEFCRKGLVHSEREWNFDRRPIIKAEWTDAATDRVRGAIVTRSGKIIEGVKVNASELSFCVGQKKATSKNGKTIDGADCPHSSFMLSAIREQVQKRRTEDKALSEEDPIGYVEAFKKAGLVLFGANWIGAPSEDDKLVLKFGETHQRFAEAHRRNVEREGQFDSVERWLMRLGLVAEIRGHRYVSLTKLTAALAEYANGSVTLTPRPRALPDGLNDRPPILKPGNIPTASPGNEPEYRTGLAGKPTSWYLIEQECRRRYEAGERHDKASEWAKVLQDWLGQTHRDAPQPKLKTLTNRLAGLLRELKAPSTILS